MAKKTTKRALFLSVMSLFICFTMLIGTTYAWFTDSVTSTGNIIKTGTLDVTLEYSKELLTDKDSDKWIDASTGAIFNHGNWEPGYTEVRYVKVENEGSLDLKFMLSIIPSEKTADNEPNLADVIDVYIAKTAVSVDRNLTDLTLVGTLSDLINDPDGAAYGVLYDKDEAGADTADEKVCVETYTLVLKMQETAGNEYQNRTVGGTFAVQLLATQLANEIDDVKTPDYDAEATYPDVVIDNTEKEEGKAAQVATQDENGDDEVVVDIPEGAPAGNYSLEVTDKQEITDAEGNTTLYMNITLKKDGAKVTVDPNGNVFYTVSVNVGAGRVFNKLVHDGKEITDYDYDTVSGIVTFTTDSFSPFEFGYYEVNNEEVKTPDEFAAAVVVGGAVKLEEEVAVAEPIVIPEGKEVVIDLNGKTITAGDDGYALYNESGATVVLTDSVGGGEIKGTVYNANGSVMTINGGIYTAVSSYAILNDAATLTINSATINGTAATYPIYSYNDGQQLTINDVTINGVFGALNAYGKGAVVINGGTYNMTGVSGMTSHVAYFSTGATVTINGGSFNHVGDISMSATGGGGVCVAGSANVTINGGLFNGDYADVYNWGNANAVLAIKGGTFAHAPEAKYIAAGYFLEDNGDGTSTVVASVYVGENGFATLQDAVNAAENGATIVLNADVTVAEPVVIPEGKEIVIELNGKALSTTDIGTIYAINNHGTLTIKDSVGTGTVNARGMYNGYDANENHVATAKLTIEGGTFNAMGTNGGAAVYNYGVLDINGGTFKSNGGYALNNQATGVTTVSGASVTGGIYNLGTLTVEGTDVMQHISGRHAIYNWSGNVTINSGNFDSISGNELILADGSNATVTINGGTFDKTAKSWLFGAATGKNITFVINGGTFNGYVNLPENSVDTIRPYGDPIVVYGGTYNFNPTTWVAERHQAVDNGDGTWTVGRDGVEASTADELKAALENGGKVYLTSDITLTEKLSVSVAEGKTATLELDGHMIVAEGIDTMFEVQSGNIVIQNGTLKNVAENVTTTKVSVLLSGDAVAEIKNVNIETTGTGILLTDNAKITELNAKVRSYVNANGYCAADAVSLVDNARIDKISGGEYISTYTDEFIAAYSGSFSGMAIYPLSINSENASVGEISGGTFLGRADDGRNGATIFVNAGKIEKISGGYFGYCRSTLRNYPYFLITVNTANGASIDAITGGTFEYASGFGCDFANIVSASGCEVSVREDEKVTISVKLSSSTKTKDVAVWDVVSK